MDVPKIYSSDGIWAEASAASPIDHVLPYLPRVQMGH